MKKIFLFLFLTAAFAGSLYSQCTPVQFPGPSFTQPDTAQGLKPVVATAPYHQVIHLRIPHDTIVPPMTVPINIDSAGVVDILGMPSGLSYVTNSPSDFWPGGSYGCLVIQGTASEQDTGKYKAEVQIQVMVMGNPLAFSYFFDMEVIDSINVGFAPSDFKKFTVMQNNPNPFDGKTEIKFNSMRSTVFTFEVFDMVGNRVRSKDIFAVRGVNKFVFEKGNLPAGVYFYRLSDDENSVVKRMIIR